MSVRAELLERVADRIDALRGAKPVRVAVDGPDAAGKTVLAGDLGSLLRDRGRTVIGVSVDDVPRRPELREVWDLSLFLTAPFETRLQRALLRDVPRLGSADEVERRYRVRYEPGQRHDLAEADPERFADITIDTTDAGAPMPRSDTT